MKALASICILSICVLFPLPANAQTAAGLSKVGEPFATLEMLTDDGLIRSLADYKGKVILVETIAIECPASQALAGASQYGSFQGPTPQERLLSFDYYFTKYSHHVNINDEDLIVIHLLVFDRKNETPKKETIRGWKEHFHLGQQKNRYVYGAPEKLTLSTKRDDVPGFYLIDKKFVLRSVASGSAQQPLLYSELLPLVPQLLLE